MEDDGQPVIESEDGFTFKAGIFDIESKYFLGNSCKKTDRQRYDRFKVGVVARNKEGVRTTKAGNVLDRVTKTLGDYLAFLSAVATIEDTAKELSEDPNVEGKKADYVREMFDEAGLDDDELLEYIGLFSAVSGALPKSPFEIVEFSSYKEMVDYTTDKRYMSDPGKEGLCFGFYLEDLEPGFDVKMFYSDSIFIEEQQNMPFQIDDAADPYVRAPNEDHFDRHTSQGFSYLQNWIANAILVEETGEEKAYIDMGLILYPTAEYRTDDFGDVISGLLPFFLLLIYVLPVGKLIERMVSEKESRARESMKIMGMSDTAYYLSWFSYFAI